MTKVRGGWQKDARAFPLMCFMVVMPQSEYIPRKIEHRNISHQKNHVYHEQDNGYFTFIDHFPQTHPHNLHRPRRLYSAGKQERDKIERTNLIPGDAS